jgi:putative NIF3 family GTP cyclohydrolase 1 type 2
MTAQELLNQIEKQLGIPWQSQRPDGYSDGILFGSGETVVTGIATTYIPTLAVLRRAVSAQINTIICRESPFYSRGERAPVSYRNGAAPPKELIENDSVCRAKRDFLTQNNLVIIRFFDNWDARQMDGQLFALARALTWDRFHLKVPIETEDYDPRNVYFNLSQGSLHALALDIAEKLKIKTVRVIGDPSSLVSRAALTHGLILVSDLESILRRQSVDVVVTGDAVEWEAAPYFQDLVTARMAKGLILIGDEASEEPGCGEVASWLKGFVKEIAVEWIPAGEAYSAVS